MKKKYLLFCITVLIFGTGCSMPSMSSFFKDKKTESVQVSKKQEFIEPTFGDIVPKNSPANWEGYYFGKFPCPNCRGVEIWLHLKKVDGRGEYVFREKFLGLKNRYNQGGLGWNEKGDIATLMSNNNIQVSFNMGLAYLMDSISTQKFPVEKISVFENQKGVFLLDKSTIQNGLTRGNKTLKFRGITNLNQISQDGYRSLKASYFFNCKNQTYSTSRASYYQNTFAMGKFVYPQIQSSGISELVYQVAKKYCN